MRIGLICFSLTGYMTGNRLVTAFRETGDEVFLTGKSRYLEDSYPGSTRQWAGEAFENRDALIFIGACGIAVRSIAPFVESKKTDPAVLVVDECGKYVISLLSGHLGGANALAEKTAKILGATSVVTTATDLHRRFAVDVFSSANQAKIFHMKAAKEASAALLAGRTVGFYTEFPYEGELPEGLVPVYCPNEAGEKNGGYSGEERAKREKQETREIQKIEEKQETREKQEGQENRELPEIGIAVTIHRNCLPFKETVQVVPPAVVLGVGCRKGREAEAILEAVRERLSEEGIYEEAVQAVASIDLKKEESGLLALAKKLDVPFHTFSAEELQNVPGDFTPSAFVQGITGVENVCERSAVLGSGGGNLILRKKAGQGITTAAALSRWKPCF